MQQIYRRTSMPKCDFNKVAKHDTFVCMANIYIIIILYIYIYIYICIMLYYVYYLHISITHIFTYIFV